MSVWYSEQTTCYNTEEGNESNLITAIREVTTDTNGEALFDLTEFALESVDDIIDYSVKIVGNTVTDILNIVNVNVLSITNTSVNVVGTLANSVTVVLGDTISPIQRCGSGFTVRLTIVYRPR